MPFRRFIAMLALLGGGSDFLTAQEREKSPEPAPGVELETETGGAERTMSESGQFLIYGADGSARSDYASRCEDIRGDFNALLQLPNRWHYSVVVQLHDPSRFARPKARVVARVYPLSTGGYRLQLDVLHDDLLNPADFRREVIRLLLMEQMIYPHTSLPASSRKQLVPPWLLDGIGELIHHRETGRPAELYASLLKARETPTLEEILNTDSRLMKDSVSGTIYRACAAGFLQALLNQPQGQKRMIAFLQDLPTEDADAQTLVRRHFPAFRTDARSLEKWWALQLNQLSQRSVYDFLTINETENELEEMLAIRLAAGPAAEDPGQSAGPEEDAQPEEAPKENKFLARLSALKFWRKQSGAGEEEAGFETGTLRDFEQFLEDPRADQALHGLRGRLEDFNQRAHPIYRSIVQGYIDVVDRLREGKLKEVGDSLAKLDEERAAVGERMREITDFMNWFSATQVQEYSGDFEGYKRALREIETMDSKRSDPISRYLDAVEREVAPRD